MRKRGKQARSGITCLSSLSSRAVSFFCFLMSSRFLRASARSLTALSLSRLRLSHNVLRDTKNLIKNSFLLSKTPNDHQRYLNMLFTVCSPSLPLSCPSPGRPSHADIWPPRLLAGLPSALGRWLHTASSEYQSPCWLAPCLEWQSPVSVRCGRHIRCY